MPVPRTPVILTIVITTSAEATAVSIDAQRHAADDSPETAACIASLKPIASTYAVAAATAIAKELTGQDVSPAFLISTDPHHRRAGRA